MRMLESYNIKSRERMRLMSLFSIYPFIGLLNVAVSLLSTYLFHFFLGWLGV